MHFAFCILRSVHCGKFYNKIKIVGLHLCLVRRLVAYGLAATLTAVQDDISALGIRLCSNGAEDALAIVCSVPGVYIYVQG